MTPLKKKNRGISVIETIIYSAILLVAVIVMSQSMISVVKAHRIVKLKQVLESSTAISMERMMREIRNATSVNLTESVLGSSPGVLTLAGVDQGGNAYVLKFDISGGVLRVSKGGGPAEALSAAQLNIDSLIFRRLTNSVSEGIRVELSASGTYKDDSKVLDLNSFAVLRNTY